MSPETNFVISKSDTISNEDRKALDLLYQPLLGSTAYSLVNILWRMDEVDNNNLRQHPHFEILSLLGIDLKVFCNARIRLEGAGLLRTLYHKDSANSFYVYQLIPPLPAPVFFNEDLLSVTLLDYVGKDLYLRLYHDLTARQLSFEHDRDLTKNFLDVYNVDSKNLSHIPATVRKVQNDSQQRSRPDYRKSVQVPDGSDDNFSFQLLLDTLKNTYVNLDSIREHAGLIKTEHLIYGLDELSMAHYIVKATDVVNNKVNFNDLKFLIADSFQNKSSYLSSQSSSENTLSDASFSSKERQMLKIAKSYSPVAFLMGIRKSRYNTKYLNNSEQRSIKMALQHGLKPPVVNILIYYLAVDKNEHYLRSNLMMSIASDWADEHVETPESAIHAIQKYQSKVKQRVRRRSRYHRVPRYSKAKPIKESMPKWYTHPEKDTEASPAKKREARLMMKKLNEEQKNQKR